MSPTDLYNEFGWPGVIRGHRWYRAIIKGACWRLWWVTARLTDDEPRRARHARMMVNHYRRIA